MGFRRHFGSWLVGLLALAGFLLALAYAASHALSPTEGYYVAWITALACLALMVTLTVRAQKGYGPALEWSLPESKSHGNATTAPPCWLTIVHILVYLAMIPTVILGYYEALAGLVVLLMLLSLLRRG